MNKISNSRMSEDFFREVWRQTMCGYTNAHIVENLDTSLPTLRRAQKRIRLTGRGDGNAHGSVDAPLYKAAAEFKIPTFLSWDSYIAMIRQLYLGNQQISFMAFHECMSQCDASKSPRKYANAHLQFEPIQGSNYTINFVRPKDDAALLDEEKARYACRSCPLKQYKHPVHSRFLADGMLFPTLMFYLSRFRFRNMEDFEMAMIYKEAAIFGMIHEISYYAGLQANTAGHSKEQCVEQIETVFVRLCDDVFEEILVGL